MKLHNAVAEVLCSMWKVLGGDAASDHKTIVNGRVLGQNPCTLPSGNRVDAILFGAEENGPDVFIDVSVACSECHTTFESAMQTREKKILRSTKPRLKAWLIAFLCRLLLARLVALVLVRYRYGIF